MSRTLYLEEIPEPGAEGSVAATYADIRRVLGVPFVVFVYRALAAHPGRLERIWADLAANLASAAGRRAADALATTSLGGVEPLPAGALGVTAFDARRVAATLTAFRRANSANAVAVRALLDGAEGRPGPTEDELFVPLPATDPILPIAGVDALPTPVRRLLEDFSAPIAGDERPILIPSLLRALAYDPCLLALLWTALRPALAGDGFRREVARVRERAAELASGLPHPVGRVDDPSAREILRRFAPTIPGMLVTGSLLEAALPVLG